MKKMLMIMKGNRLQFFGNLIVASTIFACRSNLFAKMLKDLFDATVALDLEMLIKAMTFNLTLIVGIGMLQPVFWYFSQKAAIRVTASVREQMFARVKNLPIQYFKNEHSGDLISRFNNDIQEFEQGYVAHISNLFVTIAGGIGAVIYMYMLDYRIATITLLTSVVGLIINALYAKPLRRIGEKIQNRLSGLTQAFSDIYAGLHVVKSFNLQEIIVDKFLGRNNEVFQASMMRVRRNSELTALNHLTRWLDILGYVLIGAYFAIQGWVTVGVIMAISQLKNPINWVFTEIGMFITGIQAALAAGDRIMDLIEREEEPEVYAHLTTSSDGADDYAVILENVHFGYQDGQKLINNLSFKVKKGTKVALAGPSGGGKSTIFKLLLGFYPPACGEIVINGQSLGTAELNTIREQMSYVPQNAHLFTGTIEENIRYGNEKASEEDVIRAARIANAHEFIMGFDEGYKTMVGERGAQLSGGQRQRIAIARAVLKDAPILLLDEATSSLDTEAEHVVQDALDKLSAGRTTIVIAHRFATIQDADEIFVIAEGMIKEHGNHDELLARATSLYKNLYEQQFQLIDQAS